MRSFISLKIDTKSKESIAKVQDLLKSEFKNFKIVKFEKPANFHITIFFIGEISDEKLNEIYELLKNKIEGKIGALEIELSEIRAFPDLSNPKVIFLKCVNPDNKIFQLSDIIKSILSKFGYDSDYDFYPHITLARIKSKIKAEDLTELKTDIKFSISKLSIMKSTQTRSGSLHEELFSINL